jgi:hypothetical protein
MARSTKPTMRRSAVLSWFTAIFLKSSVKASSSSKLLMELMIALFFRVAPKLVKKKFNVIEAVARPWSQIVLAVSQIRGYHALTASSGIRLRSMT